MRIWVNKLQAILIGSAVAISTSLLLAFLQTVFLENSNGIGVGTSLAIKWQYIIPLVLSPVMEELLFRKWLPEKLQKKKLNKTESVIISNILFTAFHFNLFFLPYLINSFVYSHFYHKTMDIRVPIITHLTYNWVIFMIACL